MRIYPSVKSHVQNRVEPLPFPFTVTRISHSEASSFCLRSDSENGAARPPRHTRTPCMWISVFNGSKATPELPAADRIRPQFGSDPAIAVFTSGELAMLRAILAAPSFEGAP